MIVEFSIRPVRQQAMGKDGAWRSETVDGVRAGDRQRLISASIEGSWDEVKVKSNGNK